jgi:hypothetical protein
MTIRIEFNKDDLTKYFRALDRLEGIAKKLKVDHPLEASQEYAILLKHNFISQKYAGAVKPLKDSYKAWKKKHFPGTEDKIGILTFSLVSKLSVYLDELKEEKKLKNGEVLIFEDCQEHFAYNHGDKERTVLVFDILKSDIGITK